MSSLSSAGKDEGFGRVGDRLGGLREGLKRLSVTPHAVQQDGQFAGHGHDGPLLPRLPPLAASFRPQRRNAEYGAEAAQDVLRRLYQQAAQIGIAGLGNAALRVACPDWLWPGRRPRKAPAGRLASIVGGEPRVST